MTSMAQQLAAAAEQHGVAVVMMNQVGALRETAPGRGSRGEMVVGWGREERGGREGQAGEFWRGRGDGQGERGDAGGERERERKGE